MFSDELSDHSVNNICRSSLVPGVIKSFFTVHVTAYVVFYAFLQLSSVKCYGSSHMSLHVIQRQLSLIIMCNMSLQLSSVTCHSNYHVSYVAAVIKCHMSQ